ncbi:MAG: RidA family protein [Chitinophagales bacterium]
MPTQRRSALKKIIASIAGIAGIGMSAKAMNNPMSPNTKKEEKVSGSITYFENVPLFSTFTRFGDLIYVAGIGAHVEPFEIKAHTEIVLKQMEKVLIEAGSSMEKVLKVSVFLNDIADYKGMNEVYGGRFGENPPVRTTVAVMKGGVPGNSLVEMDCIAHV